MMKKRYLITLNKPQELWKDKEKFNQLTDTFFAEKWGDILSSDGVLFGLVREKIRKCPGRQGHAMRWKVTELGTGRAAGEYILRSEAEASLPESVRFAKEHIYADGKHEEQLLRIMSEYADRYGADSEEYKIAENTERLMNERYY